MSTARRRILACLPAALAPGAAMAFRLEVPTAEVAEEYAAACPAAAVHEALRAELDSAVDGRALSPAVAPQLEALARCPFCGCSVLGAADHGEAPAPRG